MSTRFYSHLTHTPDGEVVSHKLLREHLREVAGLARRYARQLPPEFAARHDVEELAHWAGLTHDFGKYTSYFQHYLQTGRDPGKVKNHGHLSAFWAAYVLLTQNTGAGWQDCWLLFMTVWCHHGQLDSPDGWIQDYLEYLQQSPSASFSPDRKSALDALLRKQLPDILKNRDAIAADLTELGLRRASLPDFVGQMKDPDSDLLQALREAADSWDDGQEDRALQEFNRRLYVLFSLLIDADKRDAARINVSPGRVPLDPGLVDRFLAGLPVRGIPDQMLRLRSELYRAVNRKVQQSLPSGRLFTLTAPTGSGKTLTALNFALKLRDRMAKENGFTPRIIYALPFTSIIDQNHRVFARVLEPMPAYPQRPEQFLLKHHHLADIRYRLPEGPELPLDQALLMTESWESEIIVTTFVQLFESLITARNRALKKFHNIAGAVLILDEVQNVPVEYWPLVRKVLLELTAHFGCRVVLMTATQPLLFSAEQAPELVENAEDLFRRVNRVTARYHRDNLTLEEFTDLVLENLSPDRATAVIVNTIRSSIQVYRKLRDELEGTLPVVYLSSNILPRDRQERIARLKDTLDGGRPVLLVSTQVIEAGVDLDFDLLYRDIAPVDSVIQAAGRTNRHGKKKKSELHIVRLVDEDGRLFAHRIYGRSHIEICARILETRPRISEPEFYGLVRQNYRQLVEKVQQSVAEEIFRSWWQGGDYSSSARFHLIERDLPYADVFVEADRTAAELWQRYRDEVLHEADSFRRRLNYLRLRAALRRYVLSVPLRLAKAHFWDQSGGKTHGLGYIPRDWLEEYYDPETGFRRATETEDFIL